MSQQELEQTDQEVMGMVNPHATPEAAAAADEIENRWKQDQNKGNARGTCEFEEEDAETVLQKITQHRRKREKMQTVLCVAVCALILILFMVSLYVPKFVVWLANMGISCCITVAVLRVDRWRRK